MYEVKADALEESFDALAGADRLAVVEADIAALKGQVAGIRRGAVERPALDGVKGAEADPARAAFVDRYLRRGQEAGVELKSLSGATGASGGYAVPREVDAQIDSVLKAISPIRAIANVVRTGTAGYRKLVASGGTPSGWASETGARAETATPTFNEIAPPWGELYANPAASQAMLDDAAFDVEGWLAGEIAQEFAKAEGAAFVNGTGTNQPRGFLSYQTSAAGDGARSFGTVQHVPSGVSGAFPSSSPQDVLIDLVQSLRAPYRQGAAFVMNSATLSRIRKFKTADGAFLWQPAMAAGAPATLLGYPVIEAEDMPDIGADSLSIAFGDFRRGYVIAERSETSILRDPYSNKPFVHFYAVKRLGGAVTDSNAIKLLKFATS
ncbi:phage capsid protein [Sphingobium jiangsuense]|uniref:HK97 family phage major capsid protein n=1 Tax=Sphingobium jiangsuense TaxID=870476 RepID=A0A7W6BMR2_9SPHN|nr:phage major capsid protein [Sphingobium jiangsuense]MBB3925463.1 HK97 family phage major capsid protein [Sphingobium jiangsuense]GLT02962.1 phage capsid protein [Sphingobium jiangsuense]